ncbi:MAG: sugar transferase [Candidatus Zixiibacteriota bacterium]|nr:MAG: sugar transferase [candidate division Zixibacteria bacterium]
MIKNNIETKVSTTITVPDSLVGYGRVIAVEREQPFRRPSFAEMLKFYYGEFIAGILFISALFLYTIIMPEGVVNPLKCVFGMLDRFLKKVLDITGAVVGILLAIPIFVVVPILIRLDSKGPVFYTQSRIGINRRRNSRRIYRSAIADNKRSRERRREDYLGRPFKVIKFRTMVRDAERKSGPVWAIENDARVTKLGRFLRKSRIDEVPQLLNVLMGDMSLVGPRPERPTFVKDLSAKVPNYKVRLQVRPGVTGLAQVKTGYDSSVESVVEKVEHDVKYIRGWSILSDVKILARTVLVVLTGKGAF